MQAMIDELAKQAAESLGQVSSKETLASFWQEYLSKNGKIPALMKNLRTVAPEERPAMGKIINELYRKGAEVIYDKLEGLHVSGHACQEELKIIHGLLKPRFFIPVHGEPSAGAFASGPDYGHGSQEYFYLRYRQGA